MTKFRQSRFVLTKAQKIKEQKTLFSKRFKNSWKFVYELWNLFSYYLQIGNVWLLSCSQNKFLDPFCFVYTYLSTKVNEYRWMAKHCRFYNIIYCSPHAFTKTRFRIFVNFLTNQISLVFFVKTISLLVKRFVESRDSWLVFRENMWWTYYIFENASLIIEKPLWDKLCFLRNAPI